MVELLMHSQHTSTAVHHIFHLHEAELVQTVSPDVHCVLIFHQDIAQALVECSCRGYMFNVFIILEDVDVGSNM